MKYIQTGALTSPEPISEAPYPEFSGPEHPAFNYSR